MAYRIVMVEKDVELRMKLNNLVVIGQEGEIWVPLVDISMIVIDNLKINVSIRLLSILAQYNIGLIICDLEHLPMGFYCSYDNHSRVAKVLGIQMEKNRAFYDEFWTKVVGEKIKNQIRVLNKIKPENEIANKMESYLNKIQLGDVTNREAHAAKVYFNELMGKSFSRGDENILLNSGLDYGYSIIRSYIARTCVGYGLNCQIGIHHKNEFNRFNLVDDLMEPIRPFVDYYAYRLLEGEDYFKVEHRHKLVNILNHVLKYNGKNMYLANVLEMYVAQYVAFLTGKREGVLFPNFEEYRGAEV